MADVYLTKEGFEKVRQELEKLNETRKALEAEIEEARQQGDLSENAGYTYAREKKNIVLDKINELEIKLRTAKLVDKINLERDEIGLGAEVVYFDTSLNKEKTYLLTSEDEADPAAGRISVSSPLAQGLLGHRLGETVEIKLPAKTKTVVIKKITYL
ncbi:MAG: transcription elongation factor GreA [Elusimicrobiales bacterium]|jgi:transcription elongation factor GreA|nr:transcription elongation factor GreA [Elusimicrobiales bacterium]